MRSGFGDLGWWFDTSALTAEETVQRVLTDADKRGLITDEHKPLSTA